MKTDVSQIIKDHFATLRDAQTHRILLSDIALFFGLPLIAGVLAFFLDVSISKDAHGISVSIFGIFVGLLFNVQIAMFTVLQRPWAKDENVVMEARRQEMVHLRRALLGEINSNISYLVVFSSFALLVFFLFYVSKTIDKYEGAFTCVIYAHFFLTLLMVTKRAHAAFSKEYAQEADSE